MSEHPREGRIFWTVLVVAGLLCLAPAAQAQMATMSVGAGGVEWTARGSVERLVLTVAGNGRHFRQEFSGSVASFAAVDSEGIALPDGAYNWELTAVPRNLRSRGDAQTTRGGSAGRYGAGVATRGPGASGTFTVVNGAIVDPDLEEPRPARRAAAGLRVTGDMTATGAKNFVIVDPADPERAIYFAALEGPEAGTYFRGNGRTVSGEAAIELPDYFAKATEAEGLTVQLTPVGGWHQLYVAEVSPGRLVVRDAAGGDGVEFSYFVQGVRKGYLDYQVERSAADLDPR